MTNNWLIELNPTTVHPKCRIICFPFAGGGTSNFARWRTFLGSDVALYAFNLPGRERFFNYPFITDYRIALAKMHEEITVLNDLPLIFFGHSFGALSAYFNALELVKTKQTSPVHVFISARRPPDTERFNRIAHFNEDKFLSYIIKEYNGIPDVILNNKETMALFLPIIKNDFLMYEQYPDIFLSYQEKNLSCDITTIAYDEDLINPEELNGWGKFTSGKHIHHTLSGGHFQILDEFKEVITLIKQL